METREARREKAAVNAIRAEVPWQRPLRALVALLLSLQEPLLACCLILRAGDIESVYWLVIDETHHLLPASWGIAEKPDIPASETRALIRAAIEQRYTAPA